MSGAQGVNSGLKFHKKNSPIHNMDPRIKFFYLFVTFAAAILFSKVIPLAALFIMLIPLVFLAKVGKNWLRSLRASLMIFLVIFVLNSITSFLTSNYILTVTAIENAFAMALRFLVLISAFSFFFLTTSADSFGMALEQSGVPYGFTFAFTSAVRFVPVFAQESGTILDAQKARGLELQKGNYIQRIKNYVPLLIPLIVSAVRRSLELAEAMEARAWGVTKKRTHYFILKFNRNDIAMLAFCLSILTVAIYIFIFVQLPMINQLL